MAHTKETIEDLAKITHEANRAFCQTEGDISQSPWEETSEHNKEVSRNGVEKILNNPNITPEELHENWSKDKVKDGWVYGDTKDPEKKTHPCLVPYDELPISDRFKDILFHGIVRSYIDFTKDM